MTFAQKAMIKNILISVRKYTKETGKARHPIVIVVAPKGGATDALGSSSYKRTKPSKLGTSKSVVSVFSQVLYEMV